MASMRPALLVIRSGPANPANVYVLTCGPIQIEATPGTVVERANGGCLVKGSAKIVNVSRQPVSVSWSAVGCSHCSKSEIYTVLLKPAETVNLPSPPDGSSWFVASLTRGQVEFGVIAIGLASIGVLALAAYGAYSLLRGRR
jgi:hypothetical protein